MSDQTAQPGNTKASQGGLGGPVSRRGLLRTAGASAAVVGGGGLLEACSSSIKGATGGCNLPPRGGGAQEKACGVIPPPTPALAGLSSGPQTRLTTTHPTSPC